MRRRVRPLFALALLVVACSKASPTEPIAVDEFKICPCDQTYYVPTRSCVKAICPCGYIFDAYVGCIAPPVSR